MLERPDHESVARVATPEGAVAVENDDFRSCVKDEAFQLLSGPPGNCELR